MLYEGKKGLVAPLRISHKSQTKESDFRVRLQGNEKSKCVEIKVKLQELKVRLQDLKVRLQET